MSAYRRNIFVGLTMVGALFILAWMMLRFGGQMAGAFAEKQIPIHLTTPRADGVSDGAAINFRGVIVGRVTKTRLAENDNEVIIDGLLNRTPPLPANVVGVIRSVGLVGGIASIALEVSGPASDKTIQANQNIPTRFAGQDLLPPEFADLCELVQTTKQLRESNLIKHIDLVVTKTTTVVDSIQKLVGDDKVQTDLKQSVAELRETMQNATKLTAHADATLTKTQAHIDDISRQVGDQLLQAAKMLQAVQSIANKIDQGQGTAGKLVNDPLLYESLVDTSKELNVTIKDLKRLVEQWEQEGIYLKVR